MTNFYFPFVKFVQEVSLPSFGHPTNYGNGNVTTYEIMFVANVNGICETFSYNDKNHHSRHSVQIRLVYYGVRKRRAEQNEPCGFQRIRPEKIKNRLNGKTEVGKGFFHGFGNEDFHSQKKNMKIPYRASRVLAKKKRRNYEWGERVLCQ